MFARLRNAEKKKPFTLEEELKTDVLLWKRIKCLSFVHTSHYEPTNVLELCLK